MNEYKDPQDIQENSEHNEYSENSEYTENLEYLKQMEAESVTNNPAQSDNLQAHSEKLEHLKQMENTANPPTPPRPTSPPTPPNILDGWGVITNDFLPYNGILYPPNWRFAYRCPTVKEIARFSAVPENDTQSVLAAIDDLIRKCIKIYDIETDQEIPNTEINKSDKIFFLLKIRDYYLPQQPIKYSSMCSECYESFEVDLTGSSLSYPELSQKLIDGFDGRRFTIDMGLDQPIMFYIPTVGTYGRVLNYIIKAHKQQQQQRHDIKVDKVIYDKVFMNAAPFLFETGTETVQDIIKRFKAVYANDKTLEAYMAIYNNVKLDNLETINQTCPFCHGEEAVPISFPDGITKLFQRKFDF
jgi:hypothetical protein